ncbi:hypothetical protein ACFFRR_010243 [Megaselia abdita]
MLSTLLSLVALGLVASATPMTSRIVGGEDAAPGQFPYQISLRMNGEHICGGSIIKAEWILTAAHCVVKNMKGTNTLPVNLFNIRAGSVNISSGGVIHEIEKIIVNEHHWIDMLNDLALLKLAIPLVFNNDIQPIPLNEEALKEGTDVVISGWGLLYSKAPELPEELQFVHVKTLSTDHCLKRIFPWNIIIWRQKNSILCLSHPRGKGACQGDSGGPAAYNGKLVGVTGFVTGILTTCGSSRPDGYAKVSYHIDWIKKHMQ